MEAKGKEIVENPSDIYTEAVKLARGNDLLGWHQLEERVREPVYETLASWREKYKQVLLGNSETRCQAVDEAIKWVAPLFVVALVGIQSKIEELKNQQGVLEYVLLISRWNYAGAAEVARLPSALGYVYQGLHGAISVYTGQLDLAIELADMKVPDHLGRERLRVWRRDDIISRPESLGKNNKEAWKYLSSGAQRWSWLRKFFKGKSRYTTSLVAYYMALNIHELASRIADGKERLIQEENGVWLNIPLHFSLENQDILNEAFLMLRSQESVENLWSRLGVTPKAMKANWPDWIRHIEHWLSRVDYPLRLRIKLPHKELFEFL